VKRALLLFDLAQPPADQDYRDDFAEPVADEWESEAAVAQALTRLGFEVDPFGLCDDAAALLARIRETGPAIIFNLAEAFRGDRAREADVASLLELSGAPYTGARPAALRLCKDKALAKKLVAHHAGELKRVRVPAFKVVPKGSVARKELRVRFPAIVKPAALESSAGIARDSVVASDRALAERVRFVHESLGQDALVEEYVEGRELYAGLIGRTTSAAALPLRELFFDRMASGAPRIATSRAKWDDAYRARHGIRGGPAAALPGGLEGELLADCRRIYEILGLSGYARIDLRLAPDGTAAFLEANPNPSLAPEDDFAAAAGAAGLNYDALIGRIIALSEAEKPKRPRSSPSRRRAEDVADHS
jgi:D-alanine-D-alanine ligase